MRALLYGVVLAASVTVGAVAGATACVVVLAVAG